MISCQERKTPLVLPRRDVLRLDFDVRAGVVVGCMGHEKGGSSYYPVDNRRVDVPSLVSYAVFFALFGIPFVRKCRLGSIPFLNSHHFFELVGPTIDIVTSMLTQRELDSHRTLFNISVGLLPEFPDRNATIKDSSVEKIGMYIHFVEFVNFCVPLSKFLLCVLEYYQIDLAQLSIIGAAKVSHFELICRVVGRVPTVGTFHQFYVNSISNGWLSFSKRIGTVVPCCYSKNLDSLKNWNNHFFIDATVCPLSIPWFNGTSIIKDPFQVDDAIDLPCVELLDENRTLIQKYPEIVMMRVEMGLVDFVKSADPFNVKTGERTLAEKEVPLLVETKDMVIALTAQTIRLLDHTIANELEEHVGKKKRKVIPAALKRLELQSGPHENESGSAPRLSEEFVYSYVTPTPKQDVPEASGSTRDVNVQTHRSPVWYVVVTSNSEHGDLDADVSPKFKSHFPHIDVEVENKENVATEFAGGAGASSILGNNVETPASVPGSEYPADEFYESQNVDSATSQNIYVPEWNVTNNARRMDAEIAALKAKLEKAEEEAAKINELRGVKVSALELICNELSGQVVKLGANYESLRGEIAGEANMREDFLSLQDAAARRFEEQSAKLDAHIADVRRDMDTDLYPHMLNAITGRRWVISLAINKGYQRGLEAGIEHGQVERSLAQVEAYDPEVENKYVVAVREFENVSFSLLEELEALKDSSLALIMSALTLEGDADSTPELRKLQPSLDQATIPVYSESHVSRGSGSISHEMFLSDVIPAIYERAKRRMLGPSSSSASDEAAANVPIQGSSLFIVDYQISTLALTDDVMPVTQPQDDLYDTTVLDKPADP
ncbi:hypothetical protein Tco_0803285 [Tanacetum coccineum]|uniref:Transposase (Putative), gypsy type n=1 Tax=Tanacetum coccineum TaxID=301880 RepID=A0ABQ5A238_9ASTR